MKHDDSNKDLEEEFGSDDIEINTDDEDDMGNTNEPAIVKKLRVRLKTALDEKQKYLDSWQRDKADFINAKKRDDESKKQFLQFAEENLISELIPVLDSFELAMGNREAWEKVDKNWRTGVEYIYSQLSTVLTNHGLEKINPLGKTFDPKEQHSIGMISTDKEDEDHVVLEVVSNGYSLNGKVIKAPQVKIGEYKK